MIYVISPCDSYVDAAWHGGRIGQASSLNNLTNRIGAVRHSSTFPFDALNASSKVL